MALWLGIAALILAAYSNHFHNGFHFDDSHTIVNNAALRSLRNIPRFFTDASTFSALPANQSYRPLVSLSLAIDYGLGGGLDPFWFQASDFLWFLTQVALLGLLVQRLLIARGMDAPRASSLAAIAAGMFGVHPANADTVNYIIARSDLLSTFAILLGFALHILLPRWRKWQLPLLPVAAGILAKPVAAMYAPLFALYLLLFPEASDPQSRKAESLSSYLLAIAPAFAVCGGMALFVSKMTPKSWAGGSANDAWYLLTQPYVALLYFKTFFWPTGLSADYDLQALKGTGDPRLWAGIAFAIVLLAAAVTCSIFRRARIIGFGLLWFLIALLPTSLTPLAEVMNDHRTFFPYMGLVIALAGIAALIIDRAGNSALGWKPSAACAALLFLCAGASATYRRNEVWRDDEQLWRDAAIKGPGNGRALMNYGAALMARGQLAKAYDEFQQAKKLTPNYAYLYVNLGVVEDAMGDNAQAGRDFQTGLQLGSGIPDCYTFYADWLLKQGRLWEAQSLAYRALDLSPGDVKAQGIIARIDRSSAVSAAAGSYLNQSLNQYRAGKYMAAIAAARQALKLKPDFAEAYNNIGAAWNSLGQYDLGAAACREALRLKPDYPLARNNLNYALMKWDESAAPR